MRHAVGWGAGEALRLKLNTPLAVASALMDSCLRSLQADLANAQAEVRCIPSLAFHRRFASQPGQDHADALHGQAHPNERTPLPRAGLHADQL